MVARGEVWWYEHPEQGRRPYVILTRSDAIPFLNQLLAVPATRTIRDIPTEVELGRVDGMPKKCVVSVENTTLVRKTFLTTRITVLKPERMREICEALNAATAC